MVLAQALKPPPDFSVIVVAAEDDTLRAMLSRLREQTIRERIEVVVVAREGTPVALDEAEGAAFHSLKFVSCGARASLPAGLATGARHAGAPFVALIEDHCFPEAAWAEALLARHREGYAVVGPEISNANPGTALSWCSFLLTHGAWSQPAEAGVVDTVAGDNSSYRRDVILPVGEELDVLLASGTLLHWQLRDAGHEVFLEPQAKAAHLTPSRLHSYVGSRFHNGRAFAGLWSRRWPWPRRLYFAAIAPFIALRRIVWAWQLARRQTTDVSMARVAPLLLLAMVASGFGYLAGFVLGAGNSVLYSSDLYFHRDRHLQEGDRARPLREQKPRPG